MKAQGILRTYLACISSTNHRNFFGLFCQFPKFLGLLIKRDIYKSKIRLISKLLSPFPQLPHGLGKPTKLKTKSHESVDRVLDVLDIGWLCLDTQLSLSAFRKTNDTLSFVRLFVCKLQNEIRSKLQSELPQCQEL